MPSFSQMKKMTIKETWAVKLWLSSLRKEKCFYLLTEDIAMEQKV